MTKSGKRNADKKKKGRDWKTIPTFGPGELLSDYLPQSSCSVSLLYILRLLRHADPKEDIHQYATEGRAGRQNDIDDA